MFLKVRSKLNAFSASNLAAALYGIIAFAIQVLHAPFTTFFVDFSSRHLNISWIEFALAQIVYGVWNSLNEFIFGYHSDVEDSSSSSSVVAVSSNNDHSNNRSSQQQQQQQQQRRPVVSAQRRIGRIQKWGTLWALSFCLLWFPLSEFINNHFSLLFPVPCIFIYTTTLVVYGGCFGYVTVQHRSLLVDLGANDEHERQKYTLWASVLGGIGSLSVVIASAGYGALSSSSAATHHQGNHDDGDDDLGLSSSLRNVHHHHHHHHAAIITATTTTSPHSAVSSTKENDYNYHSSSSWLMWLLCITGIATIAAVLFSVCVEVISSAWVSRKKAEEEVVVVVGKNDDSVVAMSSHRGDLIANNNNGNGGNDAGGGEATNTTGAVMTTNSLGGGGGGGNNNSPTMDNTSSPISNSGQLSSRSSSPSLSWPTVVVEVSGDEPQQQQQSFFVGIMNALRQISNYPPMRTIYIVWMLQELCCYILTTFLVGAVTEIIAWANAVDCYHVLLLTSRLKNKHSAEGGGQEEHHHHHQQKHSNNVFYVYCLLSEEAWMTLSVGCSFVIPQIVLIGLLPFVKKHGLDVVIANLFKARVALGTLGFTAFCLVPQSVGPVFLIVILLSLRLVTECVCRLQPLVISALCDEQPPEWTASVVGASSLGSKPSQSIAPLLGYALVRQAAAAGTSSFASSSSASSLTSALRSVEAMEHVVYLYGWLVLIATVPTALGSLFAWIKWPLARLALNQKKREETRCL